MPDFDDRIDQSDSPNRPARARTPGPRTYTVAGSTPKTPFTVYALHYGEYEDRTLVGLFYPRAAAERRMSDDLLAFARGGFTTWTGNGPRPTYPEITEETVEGLPPVMRDEPTPRSYFPGGPPVVAVALDGREVIQYRDTPSGEIGYVWRATGATLTVDECEELGLDPGLRDG